MAQVSSIFSQILQLVPRPLFDKAVSQHKGMREFGRLIWPPSGGQLTGIA